MKSKLFHIFLLALTVGCTEGYVPDYSKVEDTDNREEITGNATTYTVSLGDVHQEIDNFGASDAWTMKFLGKNWPETKKQQVADLLFSQEFDKDGNPKGIGLSLWRVNFGAGSSQNPYKDLGDQWSRMPCMRTATGEYQLSLSDEAGGQFWMMKAAKERGCEQFLGFSNSPPYYWTHTGYTTSLDNETYIYQLNLKQEYLDDYSEYLADLVEKINENHGIYFDYVAPINEPEWEADGTESCHASNEEISKVAKSVNDAFVKRGLSTQVFIAESGKHQFIYEYDMGLPNPTRYGQKAKEFFSLGSSKSLLDCKNVAKILGSHSYWTVDTENQLKQVRSKVGEEIKRYGIKFWQTEFCILSDDYDLGTKPDGDPVGGSGFDTSMELALYVARIIHADIVFGNASAWHWWLAVTPYDYKDGLLQMTNDFSDGEITTSKLFWTFGNFSRFIRPHAQRLGVSSDVDVSNLKEVMVSSYRNTNNKLVVVFINFSQQSQPVKLHISDDQEHGFIPYITSDQEKDNLRRMDKITSDTSFNVPARSVITLCEE